MDLTALLYEVWHEVGVAELCETDGVYYYTGDLWDEAWELALLEVRHRAAEDERFAYYKDMSDDELTKKLELSLDVMDSGSCPWCDARRERRKQAPPQLRH